jgi:hypothetical protein
MDINGITVEAVCEEQHAGSLQDGHVIQLVIPTYMLL